MDLSKLYKTLLVEFGSTMSPQMTNPLPSMVPPPAGMPPEPPPEQPMADQPIIYLPEVNMTVSLFPAEKKILFSPQDHESLTSKIRTYVNMMQQNFRIDDINFLDAGSFEMVFDPRESFEAVIQFLQQVGQSEN